MLRAYLQLIVQSVLDPLDEPKSHQSPIPSYPLESVGPKKTCYYVSSKYTNATYIVVILNSLKSCTDHRLLEIPL
jgi:hypothetical protein